MKVVFAMAAALAVASCTSAAIPPTEAEVSKASDTCAAYGFAPGAAEMAICTERYITAIREDRRARLAAFGAGLQNAGNSMQRAAPRSTNCQMFGNQLYCNSY